MLSWLVWRMATKAKARNIMAATARLQPSGTPVVEALNSEIDPHRHKARLNEFNMEI